ncbi:MAG: response regulator [Chitinivibrionales bacterium]|nr:response regulator [Chitinivibrionales bacterium]
MNTDQYSILIVDDDDTIRMVLSKFLRKKGYTIFEAPNGKIGLDMVARHHPHMVISDIQMPEMDGFALIRELQKNFPGIKRILMTGYDIDSYVDMIRQHNIGNVLPKGSDFNLNELSHYIHNLLTGEIFGLERYFPKETIKTNIACTHAQAQKICSTIVEHYPSKGAVFLEIAIDELISNAVFHGVLQMTNKSRSEWSDDYTLAKEDAVTISWANDDEKIGVAVEDPKGNLKKTDVLNWLDNRIDENILNENEHGRGFLLLRRLIDKFIVNIDPGKKTECIILNYFDRERKKSRKPLLIHEL